MFAARHELRKRGETTSIPGLGEEAGAWLFRSRAHMLLSLLGGFLTLALCIRALLPLLSSSLADNLPTNWIHSSSEQVLNLLDAQSLQPSRLDPAQQARLQADFASLTAPSEGAPPYRLLFRASLASAPLLFSLPSGDIIITDRLFTSIPETDLQLALLCRELGHLQHQHALHEAVSHNLLWLASAAFIGSAENSIKALSSGLQKARYSQRQLEAADQFARTMLTSNKLPAEALAQAIQRMTGNTSPAQLGIAEPLESFLGPRLQILQNSP